MHRVWIEVDSGVPVRKLTRYHMVFCAKSSLTCSRAKFSTRVDLDLEASRMFRPTPRERIWSDFVQAHFVRTLAYGTWLRSRVNAPCLNWGRFRRSCHKLMRHHVARVAREGILMWIRTQLPVHAPCLNWSRFRRSRQEAHTASYGILCKVEPDL